MGLQDFIMFHWNWEEILSKEPYNLKITRDNGYVMFKYNQIASDFSLPLVREARGIVFHEFDWTCVCHAFDKFGNYGEGYVQDLDWEHGVSVQEKIDGSLMKLWWNDGEWHLSTNGTIDARKAMCGDISFYELFEKALKTYGCNSFEDFTKYGPFNVLYTYMFELATCENRVVIPYEGYHIYYLGKRNGVTGKEELPTDNLGVEHPKIYHLNSLKDVIAAANELPWDEEGYVCVDKHFNRCKIKSPSYVQAHYARTNNIITTKRLIEVILEGEEAEFSIYCADYGDKLRETKERMQEAKETAEVACERYSEVGSRKDLAAAISNLPSFVKGYCFYAYERENPSFEEFTKDWNSAKWEKALGG